MFKLMKLELRRNRLGTYVFASAVSCAVLLAFLYFTAYVAQVETGPREVQFRSYANIFRLSGVVSLVVFSVMSAVMYSRFILYEYTGKRAALLFSYPVSRSRILVAKLLVVLLFTTVSMLICITIPYIIFYITESVSQIVVQDVMTADLLWGTLKVMASAVLAVGGIGIMSMRIGFIKKSVPAALISAFLLSALYGNAAINASGALSVIIGGAGILAAIIVAAELSSKVNKMEVE